MSPRIHRVTFPGGSGHELAARLDLPAGPPSAFALFAHCFTCGKDLRSAGALAAALTEAGFGVLRFDFTGLGSSDGDFANTDFTSNAADLFAAIDFLRREYRAPQLLVGHSLGGAAVLSVAGDVPEVRAVATIGAPADTEHVTHLFDDALGTIETDGEACVTVAGREFTITDDFVADLREQRLLELVGAMRTPLLVLHSPIDEVVGVDNARLLFDAARHPKSFVALDEADHLISDPADARFAASVIAAFAERHLVDESGALDVPKPTADVVVAETSQGPFLNHVVVGEHRFLADEPTSIGGFDAGPAPYDLLGAALGACTSMTLRMYADRKGLPLDRVTVEVDHAKVHADDCLECAENETLEGRTGMIDRFERRIRIEGDELTDEHRARLLAIADKCPVHRTLEHASAIGTVLVEDEGS